MLSGNISVVMATFNGAKFLNAQLDSILNQTFKPDEILVGDDQSTDQTSQILKTYSTEHIIKWHSNPRRLGAVGNFKAAASLANPENYIAFADQDDIWLPVKLELSLASLNKIEQNGLPAMVYADPQIIDDEGTRIATSLWEIMGVNKYPHRLDTIVFGNPVSGCTMLINPALAKYIKTIPDDFTLNHDAWLTLCAFTFGRSAIVPHSVINYRQHENNLTYSTSTQRPGRIEKRIKEIFKAFSGKDDLFAKQFILVQRFYDVFSDKMPQDKKEIFINFLQLTSASYFKKKLAFRKACKAK